ncbi:MAG: 6-phosphogluconolactonase [Rhodobacteraceae bacterium]|nr:6-phosphogluconolactonase [Paracoccaceae bacterium]
MKLKEYPDRDMMMIDLADALASEINAGLMTHDRVSLAVPGGTTPGPVFDTLSAVDLDWARVSVLLTDERWVPESSDRSNARLVRQRLLTDRAAKAEFVGYYRDGLEPDAALAAVGEELGAVLPLSVLLLGMGADMHTASLFPGADRLADALSDDAPPLMALRAPGAPEPRVTLTAPALKGAMSTHILITGADKRRALENAVDLADSQKAPVCVVLQNATVHWAE